MSHVEQHTMKSVSVLEVDLESAWIVMKPGDRGIEVEILVG